MAETTTIMVRMDGRSIQRNIERIKFARDHAEVGTQEYETLSNELMKEYEILRKYKDSRFYVDPRFWRPYWWLAELHSLRFVWTRRIRRQLRLPSLSRNYLNLVDG